MARKFPQIIREIGESVPIRRVDSDYFEIQFRQIEEQRNRFDFLITHNLRPVVVVLLGRQGHRAILQDCLKDQKVSNPRIVIDPGKDRVIARSLNPCDVVEVAKRFADKTGIELEHSAPA